MNRCEWCSQEFADERLCSYEVGTEVVYRRLCPGCYFCLHAGGPVIAQPFTAAQKQLEAFTKNFFATQMKR